MVRVLAVADEEVPAFEARARRLDVDLVLAAGDLPWDYLEAVVELLAVPTVFVPGNHDPSTRSRGPHGVLDADERVVDVGGLRIAGLGGCVRYNDGDHQYTQQEFFARAGRLLARAGSAGVDVLLTHAPPSGLGDEADPAHVGVEALHDVVRALTPTWLLHGHIHPYGMGKPDRQLAGTTVRNVIPWTVFEIEPRTSAPAGSVADQGSRGW